MYGARLSLPIGLLATSLSVLAGAPAGLAAGYYAGSAVGWIERLIMRVMDILLAFPAFLLALMLVSALGPGLGNAMLAVGIVGVPVYARIAHAAALAVREREFVAAAQASGASDATIIWRHLLPNSVQPLIVQGTLGVATAILAAAGLSFLGLGARPPAPEWGAMLNDGRVNLDTAPWTRPTGSARTMRPLSRHRAAIRWATLCSASKLRLLARSATTSTPAARPMPRTSPTRGSAPTVSRSRSCRYPPVRAAFPIMSSPIKTSRFARAAAAPTGWPLYVYPWAKAPTSGDPSRSTDHTFSEISAADRGK